MGIFKAYFEATQGLEYVKGPVVWALYQTWKQADKENKEERTDESV